MQFEHDYLYLVRPGLKVGSCGSHLILQDYDAVTVLGTGAERLNRLMRL